MLFLLTSFLGGFIGKFSDYYYIENEGDYIIFKTFSV